MTWGVLLKKILVVVDNLEYGGIAKVVKNFASACNRIKSRQFDFICYSTPSDETLKFLKSINSNLFIIPRFSESGFYKYMKNLQNIMKDRNYCAIHIHTAYLIWIAALAAKKANIPIRVGHAHGAIGAYNKYINSSLIKIIILRLIEILGRRLNNMYCTNMLSCAKASGEYTFGRNYEFIPNIIDFHNIRLVSDDVLIEYRKKFYFDKADIILGYLGHIGGVKNTKFLLSLFRTLGWGNNLYHLLIVGDGPEKKALEESAKKYNINNIKFLGHRDDNYELLQLFDILLVPSFSEGMSLSIIEAQICGTPVVVSKGVPDTNNLKLGLYYKANSFKEKEWEKIIQNVPCKKTKFLDVEGVHKLLADTQYSEENIVNRLDEIYNNE